MSDDKYLRTRQVLALTGLSRATIYNMMKAGTFPPQTVLGARAVAWRESEINTWMDSRKNQIKTAKEAKPGRPPRLKAQAPASVEPPPVKRKLSVGHRSKSVTRKSYTRIFNKDTNTWELKPANHWEVSFTILGVELPPLSPSPTAKIFPQAHVRDLRAGTKKNEK